MAQSTPRQVLYINRAWRNLASLNVKLAAHQPDIPCANTAAALADAYELICSLKLLRLDANGCGARRGIELMCSPANPQDKRVQIRDTPAAIWLERHFIARGLQVSVRWVGVGK